VAANHPLLGLKWRSCFAFYEPSNQQEVRCYRLRRRCRRHHRRHHHHHHHHPLRTVAELHHHHRHPLRTVAEVHHHHRQYLVVVEIHDHWVAETHPLVAAAEANTVAAAVVEVMLVTAGAEMVVVEEVEVEVGAGVEAGDQSLLQLVVASEVEAPRSGSLLT
jgi:hypothetical protein